MPTPAKKPAFAPAQGAKKPARAGGASADEAALQSQVRGARKRSARLEAAQEDLFNLMLADLDRRIDAVTARTDALMARAGLV
jgi:hypothetical protein